MEKHVLESIIEGLSATEEGCVRMPKAGAEADEEGQRWSNGKNTGGVDDERFCGFESIVSAADGALVACIVREQGTGWSWLEQASRFRCRKGYVTCRCD